MVMSTKTKNRWLIALCAIGLHISIGSVYAWSIFTLPLQEVFGWTSTQIAATFSINMLMFGLSAAFLGRFIEKHGPCKMGLLAAVLFGLGIAGSGLSVALSSPFMFYFTYGVLGGAGVGLGYITPVSTLIKWFPDRRGMATGLAVMGFGFAPAIGSPLIKWLLYAGGLSQMSITRTFIVIGVIYFTIMILSSLYLARPPQGWMPDSMKKRGEKDCDRKKAAEAAGVSGDLAQLTANEAIKTRRFWYLWIMTFINITCGIAIVSMAKPLAIETAGFTVAAAATLVGVLGVVNGLGRLFWASLSDAIGRLSVYFIFFMLQIAAFLVLAFFAFEHISAVWLFVVLLVAIYSCYGGGFSLLPPFLSDLFGTKQLGAIHGYSLTALAAAGIAGPMIASRIRDVTESFAASLIFFAGLFLVALAATVLMKFNIMRLKSEKKLDKIIKLKKEAQEAAN